MIDLKVLIIEDSERDAALLLRKLKEAGYNPVYERVDNREMMISALGRRKWDLIISDWVMPQFSGLSALGILQASGKDIPFIVVSGEMGENVYLEAMKAGASGYLMKTNMKCLGVVIDKRLIEAQNKRQLRRIEKELTVSEAELHNLSNRFIKMQEDEKSLLSTELHDEIGHTLAYLRLLVDRTGQLPSSESQTLLNEAKNIISRLIEQVRNIALSLKPPMLEEDGLEQAVKYFVERQAKESELELALSFIDVPATLPWDVSMAVYRIIQEALKNITRHADARKIVLEINVKNDQLLIKITNDGKGFVVEDHSSGYGLRGMREWASIFGGALAIESKPGAGTIIRVSIPLVRAG